MLISLTLIKRNQPSAFPYVGLLLTKENHNLFPEARSEVFLKGVDQLRYLLSISI